METSGVTRPLSGKVERRWEDDTESDPEEALKVIVLNLHPLNEEKFFFPTYYKQESSSL